MEQAIDPASITHESVPVILGCILTKQTEMDGKLDKIQKKLDEHDECLQIFRFSRCNLIPWLSRNKWIVAVLFGALSIWISSLDWLNRWAQWAFFPPRLGP